MNEYNFNIEEMENNDANTGNYNNNYNQYYNDYNNTPQPPQKPKKNIAGKIVASLLAMTIVSAGSIGVYRIATKPDTTPTITESEQVKQNETQAPTQEVKAENVGMLHISENSDKVLTTEEIVQKVMPAVVGIESTFTAPQQNNNNGFGGFGGLEDSFGFGNGGFGYDDSQIQQDPVGTGTGVVISEDGYIVTNAHVIYDSQQGYGMASKINVLLNDEVYTAEVIGHDVDCDLAVIKIDAKGLTPAEFGNSDELNLGEDVTAIGNPLGFDLMNTVTRGIVSGLNRNITINDKSMNLIQTDAAINSGNSGGPLINKYGQVIGINSSKMSTNYYGEASIEGICFAIPSNKVSDVVEDFLTYGYVKGKPQLGISCRDVTSEISEMYGMPLGVYVVEVTEGSASEKAGLKKGDIITAVDDVTVKSSAELTAQKNTHKAGEIITLTFVRNGEEMTTELTLDEQNNEA